MTSLCKLEDFASTFAPYIDELHDFFSRRSVRFGSAEDVAAVVERVAGDDAFHDEMASMVRAIIYRERDSLAPIELFELMVVAIGGARMEEAGEEISGSAARLLAFVRGVFHSRWKADVDTPGGLEAAGETVDRSLVESAELEKPDRGLERAETTAAGEMRAETGESEFVTASAGPDPNARGETAAIRETHPSSALFYRARVVAAARHEPAWPVEAEVPVERVATRVEAQQAEVWTPVEPIAIGDEAATMAARRRTVAAWPTVKWPIITWPSVRWPTISWPSMLWPGPRWLTLSRVGEVVLGPRSWMWGVGLCALGVAVGAGMWLHDSGSVATPVRRVERSSAALAAGQKPSPAVKSLRDEEVVAMISAAEQRGRNSVADQADDLDLGGSAEEPTAQDQLREGRSRGVRSHAMQQERAGSAVTSELKVQPAQAEAAPVAVASAPRAAAPRESFADSAPSSAAVRYGVSPALMGSRLLYAPKLQYPRLAKLAHVQGKVVVEAVVGRDGWVTAAKVLSGHRLLRGAALSVVRGLHYRPYTVNDRPLEVATIVTVNFRLHR